ncbi:GlsB/YeaQ/YmgE family stress response membrane protein [Microcoleus sp. FACHB-SPT15]|uniref:GlsB/YeaQ/YmgE family stress response membrane protein n=1 Tax=Microcoleus sp. FACHB-SPT15 TaxID=2692830 RepID=UPI0017839D1C|nr:GlsB/YeaQ/YmgE family stress response membrane protein [Microcoleus sp. FACHB-SPT15]MBD1804025.1 GlsB/YeaQ/YmgE family stress response membrane protein [Microcoleus sp. FACHB-SPT15]
MNILAWVVLGLIAGAIAKALYPGRQGGGILSTILLGIVGAFLGGTLATILTTGSFSLAATSLSIPGVILAVLGALLAVFIWNMFNRRTV